MLLTPDEALSDAIGNDDDVTDAFAELMTDPAPAALKLRQALASLMAKYNWRDITGGQVQFEHPPPPEYPGLLPPEEMRELLGLTDSEHSADAL